MLIRPPFFRYVVRNGPQEASVCVLGFPHSRLSLLFTYESIEALVVDGLSRAGQAPDGG